MARSIGVQLQRADLIVRMLDTEEWCSSERLAEELGVSSKTVKRYMGLLREQGFHITSKQGLGYRLEEPRFADQLQLNREELTLLCLALMRSQEDFPKKTVTRLRSKLLELASSQMRQEAEQLAIRSTEQPEPSLNLEQVAEIGRALEKQRLVRLAYKGLKDETSRLRRVQPRAFFHRAADWYLEAWDFDSEKLKSFRLDRIEQVVILPEPFIELKVAEELRTHPWDFGDNEATVVLEVTERLAYWLQENPVHHSQKVEEKEKRWFATYRVRSRDKFVDWVIGLRGFCLMEPDEYGTALRERAEILARTGGTLATSWELAEK